MREEGPSEEMRGEENIRCEERGRTAGGRERCFRGAEGNDCTACRATSKNSAADEAALTLTLPSQPVVPLSRAYPQFPVYSLPLSLLCRSLSVVETPSVV